MTACILLITACLEARAAQQLCLRRLGLAPMSAAVDHIRVLRSRGLDWNLAVVDQFTGAESLQAVRALRQLDANLPLILVLDRDQDLPDQLNDAGIVLVRRPLDAQVLGSLVRALLASDGESRRLFGEQERARLTLESIADGVITLDGEGRVDYLNPAAEQVCGWDHDDALGLPLGRLCQLLDAGSRLPLSELSGLSGPALLINRDGREFAVEVAISPLREGAGSVLAFHDVTQTRRLAEMLTFQATHDALTGLLNRHEFERRLEWLLNLARDEEREHTLCYLDLDQFKVINDTCGHIAGDELLRQVTSVLRRGVRDSDTVARLGGDEFGILLEHCPQGRALEVIERLRESVRSFRFIWADKAFTIGVSVGLVPINHRSENLAQLLAAADSACYAAKEAGRNRIWVYQPNDDELTRRQGEMQWVSRITQALEHDRFCLYFQEIKSLKPGANQGRHWEILLRMYDPQGGLVPPGAFLPAAERFNIIGLLDRWVVGRVVDWFARQPQVLEAVETCTINLSGQSFGDDKFLDYLAECFSNSRVPPSRICFEITETAAISNLGKATKFIRRLKEIGCRFALDDFGAGMSSFAYLKALPVDFLKIDGAFVRDILSDPIDLAMLKSINEIGQVMGIKTIAEFVENEAIVERLVAIGVDYAQGYGIARPRPLSDEETPAIGSLCATGS
ncbi:MAG: EAL domain-containing protein [Candidatus Competibacteraceae bacterium]|nr:EAL domain-containing protein [Candidatus Competibacteraceae bacterium]